LPGLHRAAHPPRSRSRLLLAFLAVALLGATIGVPAAVTATVKNPKLTLQPGQNADITCNNGVLSNSNIGPSSETVNCQTSPTPSPTPSPTSTAPSPTPTATTPTPTPTSTSTAPAGWKCSQPIGSNCGAYDYQGIPNSNGYNTYVANQAVNVQSGTTETLNANSPGDWQVVADAKPYGYTGVQTFPDVQQLMNNWTGNGWSGSGTMTDTPLNSLATLSITYSETSPTSANSIYEFAPDVWSNYGSDVMFWADTHGRCDEGAFGGTVLGNATIDGQNWTVHRYGNAGAEIIFVLDGAGGPGTCAQQNAGTINIKAGFDWLVANGFVTGPVTLGQVNAGWEITSADNQTFTVFSYAINAVPK
jgi:hypothetical protein